MKIYQHINELKRDPNTVLTIGTFDGIHLGHQEIIKKLIERSRFNKARNFLLTFNPHPRKVVSKVDGLKLLSTPEEKALLLEKMGLENLFIINFTDEFSKQSPTAFFKNFIIEKIGLKEIVIGHDHKFGKGREGTSETLKRMASEFNFGITIVDEFKVNNEIISSTKIRNAIFDGDIKNANSLLGREYTFSGKVVAGDKRGRILGYPTANIKIDNSDKLLPNLGIYAANVIVNNEKFEGLLSIGKRPTFYDNGAIVPEVYIYNFDRDIYDENITLSILDKIRNEEKFSSPEELVNQMNRDKEAGIKIFNRLNSSRNLSKLENYK